MPGNPRIAQFPTYPQVLGVSGVSSQGLMRVEFAVEHDITGIVDAADINPDLYFQQPRYQPGKAFETFLEQQAGLQRPCLSCPAHWVRPR